MANRSFETAIFDAYGKAAIVLPQRAAETALEISCTERGLLSVTPPYSFIRLIGINMRVAGATMNVEVPVRRKGTVSTRHLVHTTQTGFETLIGDEYQGDAVSSFGWASGCTWPQPAFGTGSEVLMIGNRSEAVVFVQGVVQRATRRVLFVRSIFRFSRMSESSQWR